MMSAAGKLNGRNSESQVRRLTNTRAFRMLVLAANIVLPFAVAGMAFWGATRVQESQQKLARIEKQLEVARWRTSESVKQLKSLAQQRDEALRETGELRQERDRLREEVARLSQDPKEVIERIRKELGGQTPETRADSLYKRGRDAFGIGNVKLAHALYAAALEEDSRYVWAVIGMANVAMSERNFLVAEKHLSRALQEEPQNKVALYNMASVSARLKKWKEAKMYADRTLQIDPTDEDARALLQYIREQETALEQVP